MLLAATGARAAEPVALDVLAAGTLAVPFKQLGEAFEQKYPGFTVHAQFGGSVKMARLITEVHQPADIIAVADYNVIPKYLFGGNGQQAYTGWYAGFARNAVTFVYTDKSKYAGEIDAKNGMRAGAAGGGDRPRRSQHRSLGYQTVQTLTLAEKYYGAPGIAASILANAPEANMRDTETALISALQLGQIDYLAIYRSDALQHHLRYLESAGEDRPQRPGLLVVL